MVISEEWSNKMETRRCDCCGVIELHGLSQEDGPKEALLDVLNDNYGQEEILEHCAWVMFTQAKPGRYGTALKTFIMKNKLGAVTILPRTVNRNTGNPIGVFMWRVDHKATRKWYEDNKPKEEQNDVQDPSTYDGLCHCGMCESSRRLEACGR